VQCTTHLYTHDIYEEVKYDEAKYNIKTKGILEFIIAKSLVQQRYHTKNAPGRTSRNMAMSAWVYVLEAD
jgi:hypothetical protein